MEIRRHCSERLPGGERMWRKAARIAGFNGTIEVIGIGQRKVSRDEMFARNRGKRGVTMGYYNSNKIVVYLPSAPCAVKDPSPHLRKGPWDAFSTLCHELGHHRQKVMNRSWKWLTTSDRSYKEWKESSSERSAEAYARWLVSKLREKS